MKKLFIFALLGALTTSCVSTKVHKTLQEKYDLLSNEADQLRQKSEMRAAENSELERTLGEVRREVNQLQEDTTAKFDELRALQTKYDRLSKQYDYLLDNNSTLIAASARENKALMDELSTIQSRLQAKEDSLNTERRALEKGQRRVAELEGVIRRQDSTVNYVRQKVADALLGFTGKGLTVNMRDGKVYVSLETACSLHQVLGVLRQTDKLLWRTLLESSQTMRRSVSLSRDIRTMIRTVDRVR